MSGPGNKQQIKNENTKRAFKGAVSGARALNAQFSRKTKIRLGIVAAILMVVGYGYTVMQVVPPQGNALYGICRTYIEQRLQFPHTLKIIEFNQKIPRGEDPRAPKAISHEITFSYIDGFGQSSLNTLTCEFKLDDTLVNTPWQGIVLNRTFVNGRGDHGWADTYYKPAQKSPRAADDTSEALETFFNAIPIIIANPPDLTLPLKRLYRIKIEDLQGI